MVHGPSDEAGGAPPEERVFAGLGVSAGIAVGFAHVVDMGAVQIPEYGIAADQVAAERARFEEAVARSLHQLHKLKAKAGTLPGAVAEEIGFLLDAHMQMLSGSRLVRGVDRRIAERQVNAEAAVQAELSEIVSSFAAMDDAYFAARVDDIREVGSRLVRNLAKVPYQAFTGMPAGTVIIAEDLTPAETALLDPQRIAGFATVLGGAEGHTAIMARALGLPAVLGMAGLLQGVRTGDPVIVDGTAGRLIVNPSPETLARYRARQDELAQERRDLARLARLPAVTRDGVEVRLQANIELPQEIATAVAAGAAGIGLLRTEFLFMNRENLPDAEEQYQALRAMVEAMAGQPTTIRTLDLGGDKIAGALRLHSGGSAASVLGLRGVRLSLKAPRLLLTQLVAILRASAHGPVRILLPMVTAAAEVRQVRRILHRVHRLLLRRRVPVSPLPPPLGVMIEIPAAALCADSLALVSDFLAIGTNDLTMYALAVNRADDQVAPLYNPLHPAVLRLIQFATEAANRARIPISVCGEIAGDPRYAALLVGLGLRQLSMRANSLPRVKQRIRDLDAAAAAERVRMIMDHTDPGRIAALLDDFNDLIPTTFESGVGRFG